MKHNVKQYMLHQTIYNPGHVDIDSKYSVNSLYRRQWLRQQDYPELFFLYGHYNFNSNHAASLLISNDLINQYNQFEIAASYVYNIELGNDYNLGLGLKVGLNEQNLINTNLTYFDPNEPTLDGNFTRKFLNTGFGVSLSSPGLNASLSVPYIFGNTFINSKNDPIDFRKAHYYGSVGYKFRQNDWFVFYPSAMAYVVGGSKFHGTLSTHFLSNQLMWYGLSVDTDWTASATIGVFLMSGFRVVYVIDNKFFPANQTTGFSHEFSVSYAKTIKDNAFGRRKTKRFKR
jgi:type IX secretion system PorP/SprF family membrane protein